MHRIFYQVTGFTVKEYIRNRRLSVAAQSLIEGNDSVISIAHKSGYQTPESFSRAFKESFRLSPQQFRQAMPETVLFEPIFDVGDKQLLLCDELDFNLELEAVMFKSIAVAGFQIHTTLDDNQQQVDICNFANQMMSSNKIRECFPRGLLYGVYSNMTDASNFDYTLAGEKQYCALTDETMVDFVLPGAKYAKFTLDRIDRIKEAWHFIYGSWFPRIDALRSKGYDFEIYHENSVAIYIPMKVVPLDL